MLHIHRSERADHLVEALGDLLLDALDDPMAAEVVAVPTRGVERWLTQRLSHRLGAGPDGGDGICANVEFPFPGSLIREATAVACGFDPDDDPWPPERSVWPLLDIVDADLGEPYLQPLAAHLKVGALEGRDGEEVLRRYPIVRHLADLYDRYGVHRPDMVLSWFGQGEPPHVNGFADAAADDAPAGPSAWQAELWRRLRHHVGVASPAERLEAAAARITEEPSLLALPPRLSLFGLTRLPASHLRILHAIARDRDVHLFLLYPSGRLWDKVERGSLALEHPLRRLDDPTVAIAANPLLRSWGRDSREMQLVLSAHGVTGGEHRPVGEVSEGRQTLLRLLQADIREDRPPPGAPRPDADPEERPVLDPSDDSLRVHSCHGRLRQVEVMRDAILHLLAADPTLEPREVVVMCPDIESFAPLIHAVFGSQNQPPAAASTDAPAAAAGAAEVEPGPPHVRVRLADRSIRQTNPLLAVAAQLLELASGRVTASEVLDLAGREPVRRRFRFDEDDLGQLERWVGETGIRWGLDREHRASWKLGEVRENTWQAGLDRLLLGVAMAEEDERLFRDVLPLDDVSSGVVDLAGRFAELVERLQVAVGTLQGRHSVADWTNALQQATESVAVAGPHEQWQSDQLHRVLADVAEPAMSDEGPAVLLDPAEVGSLLSDRLRGRPTRANFRTGDLTICTLVPMRSVPHRVIGLLGLDDGAFPRHTAQDGDDLLLAEPHVGDRDTRSEDRQLLLDALLAATEHLVITYEGRDPRTNQQRSPCVPIAELLDVVDQTVRTDDPPSRARSRIVVEHPLQSFDQRNFCPSVLAVTDAWSFDPVDLDGARSLSAMPKGRKKFLERLLEPADTSVIQLESLVRFVEHPVRAFLRERLGWYGTGSADEVKDSLPVELDALEQWGVGDRMLAARLGGATLERAKAAELGRGLLPPGALAQAELSDVEAAVERLADVARSLSPIGRVVPDSVEVNVRLPDGRALIGTVPDVYRSADGSRGVGIVRCLYSHLGPKHRLSAWVRFLSLTAAHPEDTVTAVTIGRGRGTSRGAQRIAVAELPALAGDADERRMIALAHLGVLADLYHRGLREPLPLYTKTSETYVDAVLNDRDWKAECEKVWQSSRDAGFDEDAEPEHALVLDGRVRFGELLTESPREDEAGPGWRAQRSRFGRLAFRLWEPLLLHEERSYPS